MALQKEIMNEFGIAANYHRIKMIENNNPIIKVSICSYVDKKYRELEKSFATVEEDYQKQMTIVNELRKDDNEQAKLQEALNTLAAIQENIPNAYKNYHVFETIIEIKNDGNEEDISFRSIYDKLKETEEFADSIDV